MDSRPIRVSSLGRRSRPVGKTVMNDSVTRSIRESYDRVAEEYARRIFDELQHKPLDRALLNLFAVDVLSVAVEPSAGS